MRLPASRPLLRTTVALTTLLITTLLPVTADDAHASACTLLSIPSLALERCVVDGGQAELDAQLVVRVTSLSSDSVDWIAGHRTSHGGTFGVLTQLTLGSIVTFDGDDFTVVEYREVVRADSGDVADWPESSTRMLVLQTSKTFAVMYVWRAELSSSAPEQVPGQEPTDQEPSSADDRSDAGDANLTLVAAAPRANATGTCSFVSTRMCRL